MDRLLMNAKERKRLSLFSRIKDGQMTIKEASEYLDLSYRQACRMWHRYEDCGDLGLVHRLRGQPSNNRSKPDARRERALELYRDKYKPFGAGPTFASEKMSELSPPLIVDHDTLRRWLIKANLWKPGNHPARRHRRRERRACFGELVQFDGSDHHWFGDSYARSVLMVMIDDATSKLYAHFFEAETTYAAMVVFKQWVLRYGRPLLLYPDRHSIHKRNDDGAKEIYHRTGKYPPTRFGEALEQLSVNLTWARSPQAKGRVERKNKTLQDRLAKELQMAGIHEIGPANEYLDEIYLAKHNAKFTVEPAKAVNMHLPCPSIEELDDALCPVSEQRKVDKTGCISWHGRIFELQGKDHTPRRKPKVIVRQRLDGQIEVLTKEDKRKLCIKEISKAEKTSKNKPEGELSLQERVSKHKPIYKPGLDHPYKQNYPTLPGV